MLKTLKTRFYEQSRRLKQQVYTLYLAYRDPRTPWYARIFALLIFAYAISPIDLIPDFIPVLGYLDDLILLPAAIVLALKLIPPQVLADARRQSAASVNKKHPAGWIAAAIMVIIWLTGGLLIAAVLASA